MDVIAPTNRDADRSDRDLLEECRRGLPRSFEGVFRRYQGVVLAYLVRRAAGPDQAADLMAETFAALLVLSKDASRQLPDCVPAWLLGTARHLLIDSYRRGRVEDAARRRLAMRPVIPDSDDLQRVVDMAGERDLMDKLAATLPPDQLAALVARVVDERDYPSIARELGGSEASMRKRVSRALHTLRRSLEGMPNV